MKNLLAFLRPRRQRLEPQYLLSLAVSVALETTRQMESQLTMRHYKGFL